MDFRRARAPAPKEGPGLLAELGEDLGLVAHQIVGDSAAVELGQEILRNVGIESGKHIIGLLD